MRKLGQVRRLNGERGSEKQAKHDAALLLHRIDVLVPDVRGEVRQRRRRLKVEAERIHALSVGALRLALRRRLALRLLLRRGARLGA